MESLSSWKGPSSRRCNRPIQDAQHNMPSRLEVDASLSLLDYLKNNPHQSICPCRDMLSQYPYLGHIPLVQERITVLRLTSTRNRRGKVVFLREFFRDDLPREMPFTVVCVTAPIALAAIGQDNGQM